jgi:predicted membrane channel-forming protein YqfA (hemolysin III family)
MRKSVKKPAFLVFIFLIFFVLLNMFIFPLLSLNTIEHSFTLIFTFWFIIIVVLYFIGTSFYKEFKDE